MYYRFLVYMVVVTTVYTGECALPDHTLYANYSGT